MQRSEVGYAHQWLSVAEAAQSLGVSARTVRRMIARGQLTAHRLGDRLIRINSAEVEACLAKIPAARSRWEVL